MSKNKAEINKTIIMMKNATMQELEQVLLQLRNSNTKNIKYRAYCNFKNRGKTMLYKEFSDRNWYYSPSKHAKMICPTQTNDHNRFKIMLFVELWDKNGKEIYEGDIINYTYAISDFETNKKPIKGTKIIISIFDMGMFHECGENLEVEVIGNIYQNPKLLKKVRTPKKSILG